MVKIELPLYSDVGARVHSEIESTAHTDIELTVQWPAVIQYQGEDELIYVESLATWQNASDLNQADYESEDRLIDSNGDLFTLITANSSPGSKTFISLESQILLPDFVELVRQHAVLENYCCSAKINAKTYQQALAMVKEINSL